MDLNEAIEQLKAIREEYDCCLTNNYGAYLNPREEEAFDLAIAVLSEKATVAPARKTDPATSHRAAPEEIKAGSAREKILLHANGVRYALTARELAVRAGLGHQRAPWKRVSELAKAGFLKPVGVVSDPDSGHQATTYEITEKGRAAVRGILNR